MRPPFLFPVQSGRHPPFWTSKKVSLGNSENRRKIMVIGSLTEIFFFIIEHPEQSPVKLENFPESIQGHIRGLLPRGRLAALFLSERDLEK